MVGAPKIVRGCTVRNDSNGEIAVLVRYEKFSHEPEDVNDHLQNASIGQGESHHAQVRTVNAGSFDMAAPIQSIEATLANGQKHVINAPFQGVNTVVGNWLFVVTNDGIESVSNIE